MALQADRHPEMDARPMAMTEKRILGNQKNKNYAAREVMQV
jgi:hypothetical protein